MNNFNKNEIHLKKSLGQNFLLNNSIAKKIANCENFKNNVIFEIGAGVGNLTSHLALNSKHVVAIEKDSRLIPSLTKNLSNFENVSILNADFLTLNLKDLENKFKNSSFSICSNLPYCISSQAIIKILFSKIKFNSIVLMLQKEYVNKLLIVPPNKNCSSFNHFVSFHCTVKKLFNVSKSNFFPKPKVDSAVVKLILNSKPPLKISNEASFFNLIKFSFAQKRKFLINSLASNLKIDKLILSKILADLKIPLNVRAQELSISQFAEIHAKLSNL